MAATFKIDATIEHDNATYCERRHRGWNCLAQLVIGRPITPTRLVRVVSADCPWLGPGLEGATRITRMPSLVITQDASAVFKLSHLEFGHSR